MLDVQITTPVANLGGSFQFVDFQDGDIIVVLDGDTLLFRLHKVLIGGLGKIAEWTVGQRGAGFCYRGVGGEVHFLRVGVVQYLR